MTEPIELGDRLELFVDDLLIDQMRGVRFELQRPERREAAFVGDAPWEDEVVGFNSVVDEGDVKRLYYRASFPDRSNESRAVQAVAESTDGGMTFSRPDLGLVEYEGSTANNIIFIGEPPFRPPPAFIDTNPACKPEERYKGLSSRWKKLYAMRSPDGLHWYPMSEEPLDMEGTFDTINTAFWDARSGCYRCFTRYFENLDEGKVEADVLGPKPTVVRAIQSSTSTDFLEWTPVVHHEYEDEHSMQLYTNATIPCPGAEHIYLSFPNRYVQERTLHPEHGNPGVNDALFMVSRDTVHWRRYAEAWVRPGLDELNWTERNNYPTWGMVTTSPTEWSAYISEHYRHPGIACRLRRLSLRPHGFVSIHAGYDGGELLTRPITLTGRELRLNYSTSAAGWVRVEIQDTEGRPVPGFSMADAEELYGDQLEGCARWKNGPDLAALSGRPVRLRFALKDADLFAFRTAGDGGAV